VNSFDGDGSTAAFGNRNIPTSANAKAQAVDQRDVMPRKSRRATGSGSRRERTVAVDWLMRFSSGSGK
jgi:hypothetical protein